jgi:hypothetical protein
VQVPLEPGGRAAGVLEDALGIEDVLADLGEPAGRLKKLLLI